MILLIANSRDFATDYVVAELRRRGREVTVQVPRFFVQIGDRQADPIMI